MPIPLRVVLNVSGDLVYPFVGFPIGRPRINFVLASLVVLIDDIDRSLGHAVAHLRAVDGLTP